METQLKRVTKEELHRMIDEVPEDELMVLTYRKDTGISDNGKMLKKKKTKTLVNRATIFILSEQNPIKKVDLEGDFGIFRNINRGNVIKTILFPRPQLEWFNRTNFRNVLTNENSCSILNLVSKTKKKPILSNGIGVPTQIDFFTYIHTNSLSRMG